MSFSSTIPTQVSFSNRLHVRTRTTGLTSTSVALLARKKVSVHTSNRYLATTTAKATPEDSSNTDFKPSEGQQTIINLDSAVRNSQKQLGATLTATLKGPLTFLGMGGTKSGKVSGKAASERWESQYPVLKDAVASIDAAETTALMKKGWVLLDVRPKEDYKAYHPVNAKNAPLNQYIVGTSPRQLLRTTLFRMQAVSPIESNPDFVQEAKEAIGKAPGVILGCAAGGTLQSTTNFPCGQASRSLIAAYKVLGDGSCKNVKHFKGGLNTWFREGLEGEGSDDEWDDTSGRTPSAAGYTPEQDSDELQANQ